MRNKNEDTGGEILTAIIAFPTLLILGAITTGWALSTLWEWFVVSTFEVPQISIAQAIGLSLIVNMFSNSTQDQKDKEDQSMGWIIFESIIKIFLKPLLVLGIGLIVLNFI